MIIYKDIITGDEMFSDIYKIKESENGMMLEVEASGSRSSSLRSTPHEELERLAGLDPHTGSLNQGPSLYFTPISSAEHKEKVDILELLHKANIDLKPLLSSLNVNKAHLKESTSSGVVLSLEEVEVGLKGLKVQPEPAPSLPQRQSSGGGGTPFMAEHLEEALTGGAKTTARPRDSDMSAFNKLVNTMKASGTLPTLPKASGTNPQQQSVDPVLVSLTEAQVPAPQQKNIFQELLVTPHGPVPVPGLIHHRASPPLFPQRSQMQDFFPGMSPATGFHGGPQTVLDQIPDLHRARNTQPMRALPMGVDQTNLEALFQQDLAVLNRPQYQQAYNKQAHDKMFRNRPTRMNRSPVPHLPGRTSPGSTVTSVLSPSFTPTSVIKKMYESKEKSRDDLGSRPGSKEETVNSHNSQDDGPPSPSSFLEDVDTSGPQTGGVKACSTPVPTQNRHIKDPERPRPPSVTGPHTPTMLSPGPSSPFPRPQMYPVPLLPHVPLVRPPPQLHPGVMQRMLAQGIQAQQLGPTLLQTGMFPQAVDLSQLQGLPPALLGQPLYPLSPAGHPLMAPRAAGTHVQLAVMQQQLQQQQRPNLHVAPSGGPQSQSHGPHRTNQRRGASPPLGLAKWFGSDMLQQPLPSMPSTKVISVDELEFRQ